MTDLYLSGKKKAAKLAKKAAINCVAYQKFLHEYHIKVPNIPFEELPVSEKKNYVQAYPLTERIYRGEELANYYMICTSSGSTDKPTIWPRSYDQDKKIEVGHAEFLKRNFQIDKKSTLIVIALGLGTTQAGVMNMKDSWSASKKAKISVISPNGDPEITIYLLENLAKYYQQVICLGYPPLISDFLQLAVEKKLNIRKWNLKIALTSESISPLWRVEVLKMIGGSSNDIVSFYGTTEAGVVGTETPETNAVLAHCLGNAPLREALFGTHNLPTLVEVNYSKKFVEIINGEVVLTVDQVVPLIRYNVHDNGILISSSTIKKTLTDFGIKQKFSGTGKTFLAIFGRNLNRKFSIEDIRSALEEPDLKDVFLHEFQFAEQVENSVLRIKIHLYKNEKATFKITKLFVTELTKRIKKNLELSSTTQSAFEVDIVIQDGKEAFGYQMGKLRYLAAK